MPIPIELRGYKNPEVLVSTDWVADHLNDPNIRIIESNEDPLLYSSRHIPTAVEVDWVKDLNDPIKRDYLSGDSFSRLMSRIGVTPDTTLILYGDRNNWWAAYALWVFNLFGHTNAKIMDGGSLKWEKEGKLLTIQVPSFLETNYPVRQRNDHDIRAFRDDVLKHLGKNGKLIDVRSPQEYTGERLHMPDFPNEGALRGGHIPGAANIPWARAIDTEDGTFKAASELFEIYEKEAGVSQDDEVIVYCRIGERSSHTWFVLSRLLGYPFVKNYDGSWTEWGNSVGLPIEK